MSTKNWRVAEEVSHFRNGAMQRFIRIKADFEENGETFPLTIAEVVVDPDFEAESYDTAHRMAAADDLMTACMMLVALEDSDAPPEDTRWKTARQLMRKAIDYPRDHYAEAQDDT